MAMSEHMQLAPGAYKSHLKPVWCPGCGDYGVLNALVKAMSIVGLEPENTVIVSGIGCSSRLPGFVATYGFHGLHGRVLPVATGVKTARPELTVIAVGGDGDGYSIGAGHLPHCARRNPDITYLVMNNSAYGLTKGQVSPTSTLPFVSQGAKIDPKRWKTTPYGTVESPLNPIAQSIANDISFIARGYSYQPAKLTDLIVEAIRHRGFSLVDILSPCASYNQEQTDAYYREHIRELPADYDPTNRLKAFETAINTDGLPTGVIYKRNDAPGITEELEALKTRFPHDPPPSMERLFDKYAQR